MDGGGLGCVVSMSDCGSAASGGGYGTGTRTVKGIGSGIKRTIPTKRTSVKVGLGAR